MAKDAASGTITAGMTYMTTSKVGLRKIARKVAKRTATGLAKNAVLGPKPPAGRALRDEKYIKLYPTLLSWLWRYACMI